MFMFTAGEARQTAFSVAVAVRA